MPIKINFYDLLELPKDATPEEIRRAYKDAARRLHPDVNPSKVAAEEFIKVQQAYETLSDPKIRTIYDQRLEDESDDPVKIDLIYSRSTLATIQEVQMVYALLELSAVSKYTSVASPPLNVCLVLDRSTSMQGVRMDTVKTAAIELIRQLKPNDRLSIIVFSDRADILLPAGQQPERGLIETQIQMIRAGGGTEILQGLQAGFGEVSRNLTRSLINHIILITDGRTYGDEEACLKLADKAAAQGLRITSLGIGTEWNDVFMDDLTARTGGSSFYISRAGDIRSFLHEKFESLNQIYAERVTLALNQNADVHLGAAYRLQPDSAILPTVSPLRLGSIPKNSKLSILLEFIVPLIPPETTRFALAKGELSLILPFDPSSTRKLPISFTRLTSETVKSELPPRPIFQALSQITLYRMQERAREEVADGKVQDASLRLQRLATQLLSMGEMELAQTAIMEAERIQQTHMLSAEGEKIIKYGTRAFLLPAQIKESE
jgi:Ca-activated chloride channel homolog